jgi:hypothetical protein
MVNSFFRQFQRGARNTVTRLQALNPLEYQQSKFFCSCPPERLNGFFDIKHPDRHSALGSTPDEDNVRSTPLNQVARHFQGMFRAVSGPCIIKITGDQYKGISGQPTTPILKVNTKSPKLPQMRV